MADSEEAVQEVTAEPFLEHDGNDKPVVVVGDYRFVVDPGGVLAHKEMRDHLASVVLGVVKAGGVELTPKELMRTTLLKLHDLGQPGENRKLNRNTYYVLSAANHWLAQC